MMTVPPQLTCSLPSFSYPASFRHPPPASSFDGDLLSHLLLGSIRDLLIQAGARQGGVRAAGWIFLGEEEWSLETEAVSIWEWVNIYNFVLIHPNFLL